MPDESSRVEWEGVPQAMHAIEAWAAGLDDAIDRRADDFAQQVAGRVADEVPVLTGTLASSVAVVEVEGAGAGVGLGDGVPYAGWIEFGGSRGRDFVPEGRYLWPTVLQQEDEFAAFAADVATDTARSYPWPTPT